MPRLHELAFLSLFRAAVLIRDRQLGCEFSVDGRRFAESCIPTTRSWISNFEIFIGIKQDWEETGISPISAPVTSTEALCTAAPACRAEAS